MYGMVNNAIQEMMVARLGNEGWSRVRARSGVNDAFFVSLEPYPDDLTYRLVGAAAEELGVKVESFLEDFGRFWIEYALRTSYGPLLRGAGRSFAETVAALDAMHSRVGMALPKLRPPSFTIISQESGLTIKYTSTREGLAPFVVGLLHGLATMHGENISVTHSKQRSAQAAHDEFRVEYVKR